MFLLRCCNSCAFPKSFTFSHIKFKHQLTGKGTYANLVIILCPQTCWKLHLKVYFSILFLALVVSKENAACINHLKWKLPPEISLEAGVSNFISKIDGIETHPWELRPIWHPLFKDQGERRSEPASRRPPLSVCKPGPLRRPASSREAWEHNPPSAQEASQRSREIPSHYQSAPVQQPHSPQKAMSVTTTRLPKPLLHLSIFSCQWSIRKQRQTVSPKCPRDLLSLLSQMTSRHSCKTANKKALSTSMLAEQK